MQSSGLEGTDQDSPSCCNPGWPSVLTSTPSLGPSPFLYPSKTPSSSGASAPTRRHNHRKVELGIQSTSSARPSPGEPELSPGTLARAASPSVALSNLRGTQGRKRTHLGMWRQERRRKERGETATAAESPDHDCSRHLLSTYYVQALFVLNTHNDSASSPSGMEKSRVLSADKQRHGDSTPGRHPPEPLSGLPS